VQPLSRICPDVAVSAPVASEQKDVLVRICSDVVRLGFMCLVGRMLIDSET